MSENKKKAKVKSRPKNNKRRGKAIDLEKAKTLGRGWVAEGKMNETFKLVDQLRGARHNPASEKWKFYLLKEKKGKERGESPLFVGEKGGWPNIKGKVDLKDSHS